MSLTKNAKTGECHTAKWPTIIAAIGGVFALIFGPLISVRMGIGVDYREIGISLLGMAGVGLFTMAKRTIGLK